MKKKGFLSSLPYRSFDGWLKCQRPYHKNELGQLVSNTTFLLFSADSLAGELSDVESSLNDAARELGIGVKMDAAVRYPDARQWLFDEFGAGKPGVLVRDAGKPPADATFFNIPPWLTPENRFGCPHFPIGSI